MTPALHLRSTGVIEIIGPYSPGRPQHGTRLGLAPAQETNITDPTSIVAFLAMKCEV